MVAPEKLLKFSISLILGIVFISGLLYHIYQIDLVSFLDRTQLCLFRAITGKKCPGCGMTHAFLAIGKLQIKEAIEYNLFSLPLFLISVIYLFYPGQKEWYHNRVLMSAVLIAALAYWILRNLPSEYCELF